MSSQHLILASSSPSRLSLLKQIYITPDLVISPNIDETPLKKEKPFSLCKRLSLNKLKKVKELYPESFIIAADTIVVRGNQIIGKPINKEEACKILTLLSGRKHEIITGICITGNNTLINKSISTTVKIKSLSKEEIDLYIQSNEWIDKSGAYSIQGFAEVFVEKIIGSYSNIVGLPLNSTYNILKGLGYKNLWRNSTN